jgi:hypothetical protein
MCEHARVTQDAGTPSTSPEAQRAPSADRRARTLANLLIVAFLGFHVAMPLTYYLSDRVYDERFSWRMFSSVRLQECAVRVTEAPEAGTPRGVDLERDLQVAWVNILKRLRPAAIEKFMKRRCERAHDERIARVELTATCTDTEGKTLPEQRFSMTCSEGALRREAQAGTP